MRDTHVGDGVPTTGLLWSILVRILAGKEEHTPISDEAVFSGWAQPSQSSLKPTCAIGYQTPDPGAGFGDLDA